MTIEIGDKLTGDSSSYFVEAPIAEGGFGITYRARREADGLAVVIKTLRIDRMKQWKSLELFEREVAVLRQLDHPNIPDYIDSFTLGSQQEPRGWALVQELVLGRDLRQLMRDGARLDEPAMLSWFRQILEVLDYLHRLAPPVIHRDVNPKNIILADDGRAFLVDFGTVQAAIQSQDSVASTAAGTFGYAPFEQFMGRAAPASDLYGLAMTYLAVSTGKEPEELPLDGNQVDVRKALSLGRGGCDARLLLLLERMAIANPEQRLSSANEALERLTPLGATTPAEQTAAPRAAPAPATSQPAAAAAAQAPEPTAPLRQDAAPDLRAPAVWQEAARYNAEHDRQAVWPMPVNLPTQDLRRFGLARDGSRVFVADYSDGWEIRLDNLRAKSISAKSPGEDFICSGYDGGERFTAVSPDGSLLAVGRRDGKLRVGPPKAGRKGATRFEVPVGLAALDFSPDGYYLVCVHPPETLLLGREGERVSVQAQCLHYHPNGRLLALGRGDRLLVGSARALEKGIGWRPSELPIEGEVRQLRFNHDGSLIAVQHGSAEAPLLSLFPFAAGELSSSAVRCAELVAPKGEQPRLLGFARESQLVIAYGQHQIARAGIARQAGLMCWNVRGQLLVSLGLTKDEPRPLLRTTSGFFNILSSGADGGPWGSLGVAKRCLRQATPERELLVEEHQQRHMADLELRERYVLELVTGGRPQTQGRAFRCAVNEAGGYSHLLPGAAIEARRAADEATTQFGVAKSQRTLKPEQIRDAIKQIIARPEQEQQALLEEALRELQAEQQGLAEQQRLEAERQRQETERQETERREQQRRQVQQVAAQQQSAAPPAARGRRSSAGRPPLSGRQLRLLVVKAVLILGGLALLALIGALFYR